MISKRMYQMISCFPRDYSTISYQNLVKKSVLSEEEIQWCLMEHDFMIAEGKRLFRKDSNKTWDESDFSLNDRGLAEIDNFEMEMENQKSSHESLENAKRTLYVAWLTFGISVIALIVSLFVK